MSVIRKTPYIETLLNSMSMEDLALLKTVINSGGGNVAATFGNLPVANVSAVYFKLDDNNTKSGILIKNATMAGLICYHRFQDLLLYKLNLSNSTFEKVDEDCTIEELRRCLDDFSEKSGDTWVESMKEVMSYDSENTEVEIGTHLYVDGKIEIGDTGGTAGDLVVGHEIVIDDLQKIVDTNGDAFIPDPSGHLNEALVHTTTGYTWKKATEMAGIQVVAKATFEAEEFVPMTNIVYVVYDTDGTCYVKYFIA